MGFINESTKYGINEQLKEWSKPCTTKNGVKISGAAALSYNAHQAMKEIAYEDEIVKIVTDYFDSCTAILQNQSELATI